MRRFREGVRTLDWTEDKKEEDFAIEGVLDDGTVVPDEGTKGVEEPQPKPKKSKVKKDPIALKTCTVRFDNADVELVRGQPISGLTSQELKYLKVHKFVR